MQPLLSSLILPVRRFVELTGDALTRLSDDADQIWEPLLVDDPIVPAAAVGRGA